jgi:SAM-dependent methyltransferase
LNRRGQRDYWDEHIESWSSSAYGSSETLPWLERLATPFRGHLRARRSYAVEVISQRRPRTILELGCGTGELLASLPDRQPIRRYVGVDISPVAIEKARARRYGVDLRGEPEFLVSSLENLDPTVHRGFDLVLGLGLTPYLNDGEIGQLAVLVGSSPFLFDFHASGPSLQNAMHWVYRRLVGFPFYRLFRPDEISRLFRNHGLEDFDLKTHQGLSFLQRLPDRGPGSKDRRLTPGAGPST